MMAAISLFVDICHTHALPVFLIDPYILTALITNGSSSTPAQGASNCIGKRLSNETSCCLCTGRRVTSFGVLHQLWRSEDSLFEDFGRQSFTVSSSTIITVPPSLAGPWLDSDPDLPSQYLLCYRGEHFISLIVFYRRGSSFLWHDALPGLERWRQVVGSGETLQDMWTNVLEELEFGRTAGAYNEFDTIKVVLDNVRLRVVKHPSSFLRQREQSLFLECNHTRAAEFYSMYGARSNNTKALMFYKNAYEILEAVTQVLDQLGVRFWLSSGTCLGWFRQCDLISYSNDVDIGIFIVDYDDRIIKEFEEIGLPLLHRFGRVNDSFELSFSGGDVKLDVFFFYEEAEYMWNGGTQTRTGNKFKYVFPKFKLCWTEFLRLRLRIPCDTLSYIEANYGQNWFQPVKTWDWKSSPPNVLENGLWPPDEWNEVIQTFLV